MQHIAALLLVAAIGSASPADPASTVEAFFAKWGAGDATAAAALWTGPPSPEFHRHVVRDPGANCITLHEARILAVRLTGDAQAEVEVELRMTKRNAMAGAPVRHEVSRALLRLRRIEKAWRIESWRESEEQLVDELLSVAPAERADWLDARAHDWTPALTRALTTRAIALINRNDHRLAGELIALATRVAMALDDAASMSFALAASSVFQRINVPPDQPASVALARESLAYAERSGDPDAIANALVRLGRALIVFPHVEPEPFQRALALADFVDDQTIPAQAASQLALFHELSMDFRMALLHAAIAERLGRAAGHDATMLSAELNFAGLYNRLGDIELAMVHYDRAAAIARRAGFTRIYASFVNLLVAARYHLGTPPAELVPLIDEALALPNVRGTAEIAHDLLSTRAMMYLNLREFEEAEADLLDAMAAADSATSYLFLAELRIAQRRYQEAREAVETTAIATSGPYVYITALRELGAIDEALAAARCANDWADNVLAHLLDRDHTRRQFAATQYDVDRIMVDLLVRHGDQYEALEAADEAKGRILLQAAARARIRASRQAPESEAERAAKEKLERINRALLTETNAARHHALRADLEDARVELEELRSRGAARINQAWRTTAPDVRLRQWPFRGVTALEYVVGERDTIIFVARGGDDGKLRLDVRVVHIARNDLARLVAGLRERIAARDLRYEEPARRLYELLIAPVEPWIAPAGTLCIIPDGDLWKVPFQVLANGRGTALVERVPLFYAASIRMLHTIGETTRPRRAPRLLALGNPSIGANTAARFRAYERATVLGDLTDAEDEVQRIARLYGRGRSAVHVRGEAREALFKEKAHEYDVLHVASHGLVDNAAPMFSALVLAAASGDGEDGLLEAHEVAELRLDADLVVLSACETAAGKVGGGEGILGLSWAFLAAGTRGLVGSQWKAPSAATESLMVAFHERLLAGDSAAAALRRAQLRVMRDERYEAPLDWAPFIVIGNGLR